MDAWKRVLMAKKRSATQHLNCCTPRWSKWSSCHVVPFEHRHMQPMDMLAPMNFNRKTTRIVKLVSFWYLLVLVRSRCTVPSPAQAPLQQHQNSCTVLQDRCEDRNLQQERCHEISDLTSLARDSSRVSKVLPMKGSSSKKSCHPHTYQKHAKSTRSSLAIPPFPFLSEILGSIWLMQSGANRGSRADLAKPFLNCCSLIRSHSVSVLIVDSDSDLISW